MVQQARAQTPAHLDSLTRKLAQAKPDTVKAALLLALAGAYRDGDVTRQFSYANEALSFSDKAHWATGEMFAEEVLGECYIKVLAYNDALQHFERSIAASRKINRRDNERLCLQFMVHCYHMLNRLGEAAGYQKILLDLTAQAGNNLGECNQMSAYAQRLADLGRYREANAWLLRDLSLAETNFAGEQKLDLLADLLNTQATVYAKINRPDSALMCLRRAAMLAEETKNTALSPYIISTFCDVYTAAKNYDSAIYYGRQTMQAAKAMKDLNLQQDYARTLSMLYKAAHQPVAALELYTAYDSLSAIINNTQRTIDQAMQVARINMEQQAAMNRLENQSLEATRKTNQALLAAALIAMLTLIVLTLIIYRSLRQKQKSNRIISGQADSLQRQNELIDEALKAKDLMLRETHHRIKNNLQLISSLLELQVAGMDDALAGSALRTAQRRIQSIATVHSRLYGSGEDELIELTGFVSDLFARLANAFGSEDIAVRFQNDIPPTLLPLDVVVLLGLILNELITNTFKYACEDVAEPAVGAALTATEENSYVLEYWDNGPGLPAGMFDSSAGSMGLHLIKRMSKQLKGTANYTYNGRSRFTISFRAGR